jgi:hypothetical protein
MKKAALALMFGMTAVGCGLMGHSEAYKAYLAFGEAIRNGNCPVLSGMATGQAADWVNSYCGYSGGLSAAKAVAEMSGSPQAAMRRFSRTTVSEETNADGSVSLVVIEHVIARPSNFSSAPPDMKQALKLKPEGAGWKVAEWAETEVENKN